MLKKLLSISLLFFAIAASISSQSLYGSGISPESALVRTIFLNEDKEFVFEVGNISFYSSQRELSKKYHPVSPGMYFLEFQEEWLEMIPQSGKYYSIIVLDNKCLIFEDLEHTSPAQNQIYFYNCLDSETASIVVSQTGDQLFSNVSSKDSIQRAVNPLNINFSLTTETGEVYELGSLPMERGGSTTIIAYKLKQEVQTSIFQAEIHKEP